MRGRPTADTFVAVSPVPMPGDETGRYAAQQERVQRAMKARRDEAAALEERRLSRKKQIDQFVRDNPPPAVLRPIERDDWVETVARLADDLFPEDQTKAPTAAEIDFQGIQDPAGTAFLVHRAQNVAEANRQLAELVENTRRSTGRSRD